jgi:hypothetical protein
VVSQGHATIGSNLVHLHPFAPMNSKNIRHFLNRLNSFLLADPPVHGVKSFSIFGSEDFWRPDLRAQGIHVGMAMHPGRKSLVLWALLNPC